MSAEKLKSEIHAWIKTHGNWPLGTSLPEEAQSERDHLIWKLARYQAEHIIPYARLWNATTGAVTDAVAGAVTDAIPVTGTDPVTGTELLPSPQPSPRGRGGLIPPAVPTDLFRFTRLAVHGDDKDLRIFRTSGTTSGQRGEHHLRDLTLYDLAARTWAKRMLFADVEKIDLIILAPNEQDAPDSSLSYMLSRFVDWFGSDNCHFVWRNGQLDMPALKNALEHAEQHQSPIALLGTSFAFVWAEDEQRRTYRLAPGSRLMQTGGFKGKSREVDASDLRENLRQRYGIAKTNIISEYGMTELSSQCYETSMMDEQGRVSKAPVIVDREAISNAYLAPPWLRVSVCDPATLKPLQDGQLGILRLDDLANIDSIACIQTSDLAVKVGNYFWLYGRSAASLARGCSLAVEEALAK